MADIETNLEQILSATHGRDVRQSIHDAIESCYNDGKAGAVDLVARSQINNFLTNTGSLIEQTLILTELYANGQTAESNIANLDAFDYVCVYYKVVNTSAPEIKLFKQSDFFGSNTVVVSQPFLEDGATKVSVRELHLSYNSQTTVLTVSLAKNWKLNEAGTGTATVIPTTASGSERTAGVIVKITGIAFRSDAEVADIRVGEDGTTYTSAGEAVRSQISDLKSDLNDYNSIFDVIESANEFNGNLTTGFINLSGTINGSTDYAYTDRIEVSSTTFVITGDNKTNGRRVNVPCRFITAYDADGNVQPTYGQQSVGTDNSYIDTDGANIITVDSNVKFIVISIYRPIIKFENISISFDTSVTEYTAYGRTVKFKSNTLAESKYATIYDYLHGKTIAVFGDSIMYGAGSDAKGAVDLLAEKYGMTVEKYCVSGATMGVRTDSSSYTVDEVHHIAKQVRNAISANITPNIIVFNGGTNDIGGQITIGEMTDVYTEPSSESYFADGFETVAYLLTKNFVGVPIIYMRAHNMSSRTYEGQIIYGELGNRIAEKWGIRNVDMYKRMNTQLTEYRNLYLADYTHPNNAGYEKYYVPALEDFIFYELA